MIEASVIEIFSFQIPSVAAVSQVRGSTSVESLSLENRFSGRIIDLHFMKARRSLRPRRNAAMSESGNERKGKGSKITVLISGNGSNFQALIDSCNTDALPHAKIVRVVSDRKDAYGLKRAESASIPTTYHGILPYKKKHPDSSPNPTFEEARKAYDADLAQIVLADNPDIVVCAGFMRIVTSSFLTPLQDTKLPIINLHPSLHGDLVGADCIRRAWDEFQAGKRTKTGVMVHYVIAEVDMGELIVQQEVEIEGCGSLEELQGRMHGAEHGLIVEGTRRVLSKGDNP